MVSTHGACLISFLKSLKTINFQEMSGKPCTVEPSNESEKSLGNDKILRSSNCIFIQFAFYRAFDSGL